MPIYVAFGPLEAEETPTRAKILAAGPALGGVMEELRAPKNIGRLFVIRKYLQNWTVANVSKAIADITTLEHDDSERFRVNETGQLRRVP